MCCLRYEKVFYSEILEKFPELGTTVKTDKGTGLLKKIDVFDESVTIAYENGEEETKTLEELNCLLDTERDKKKKKKRNGKRKKKERVR